MAWNVGTLQWFLCCPRIEKWTALPIDCHQHEATHDTINGGIWYTLQGKLDQANGVSLSLIIIPAPAEVKFCLNHLSKNPHFSTSTDGPDSPLNQNLQPIFQHKFTWEHILANNIAADKHLCEDCDCIILIPLLCNININDENLLVLKNFYDELTLSLTPSINQASKNIIYYLHNVDTTTPLFEYLVPPETSTNSHHAYQTYLMLSQVLDKDIPNYINISASTFPYKDLQHVITYDDGCMML